LDVIAQVGNVWKLKKSNYILMVQLIHVQLWIATKNLFPTSNPWIHQIWNESTYEIGDTIIFNIDVATPPKFDLVFSINEEKLKQTKKMKQGMDVYEFVKVKESNGEKLNLMAEYYLDGKKWITFKRSIEP
jgi:hypothetical protein